MTPRYGRTRISKIRQAVDGLRHMIATQGTPDIQEAWDRYEPWSGYVLHNHQCPECGERKE